MAQSDLFQKNLERWSRLCTLGKERVARADVAQFQFCRSTSGALNLFDSTEGKKIFTHDSEDPLKEAKSWFSQLILKDVDILYVYGIGLGYYYEAAKEWLHGSKNRTIVFLEEQPQVIHRFLETERAEEMLTDSQAALYLFHDQDREVYHLDRIVLLYAYTRPIHAAFSSLESNRSIKPEVCNELISRLAFFHAVCRSGASEFVNYSLPFFRNFFWNYLYLPQSFHAARMQNQFAGIPAIICGAGPSLDKNMGLLRALSDRALIFAGGTGLNALNGNGIMPHFGVGIDPNPAQFTRAVMNMGYELPFFYRTRMLHEALEIMHGDKIYVPGNAGYEVGSWMDRQLGIETGLNIQEGFNVLNFSLGVAHLLGCNPIICIGIDLAYTEGRSYPSGLIAHPIHDQKTNFQTKAFEDDLIPKTDIYGKPVFTLWKWVAESFWYSNFSKEHPQPQLINATEGGIGFPDVPNVSLARAKEIYLQKQLDLGVLIHGAIQNSHFPENVTSSRIQELMETLVNSLKQCQQFIQQIVALLLQGSKKEVEEMQKKLQAEEAYQALLKPFYDHYHKGSELERIRSGLNDDSTEALIDMEIYRALGQAAQMHEVLIVKVIEYFLQSQQLNARCKEEQKESLIELFPSPVPGEIYAFEGQVLTLQDPELKLEYSQPFVPQAIERTKYASGAIKAEIHYKEEKLHGPAAFYAENGQLLALSWYLDGQREGKMRTYYPSGLVHSVQRFRKGVPEGSQEYYYAEGTPKSVFSYENGVLEGEVVLFSPEGLLKRKLHFQKGQREGLEQVWDARGILRIEAHFQANRPKEYARVWHYNGVLAKEVLFDSDSTPVSVKQWDEAGKPVAVLDQEPDYFSRVTEEARKLTSTLTHMVDDISGAVKLVSLKADEPLDLDSDLQMLQKEAEHLQQLSQSLQKEAKIDSKLPDEMIWKSKKMQHEMEKKIEMMSQDINQQIENLGAGLKELIKKIAKDTKDTKDSKQRNDIKDINDNKDTN